jgi:hypothetical protein
MTQDSFSAQKCRLPSAKKKTKQRIPPLKPRTNSSIRQFPGERGEKEPGQAGGSVDWRKRSI